MCLVWENAPGGCSLPAVTLPTGADEWSGLMGILTAHYYPGGLLLSPSALCSSAPVVHLSLTCVFLLSLMLTYFTRKWICGKSIARFVDLLDYLFCSFTIFLNSCTLKEEGKNIIVRLHPSIFMTNDKKVEKAWPVVLVMTSIWNMRFLLEHSKFLLAG